MNDTITIIVSFFIVLYALNLSKMKLPCQIKNLFNNTIFRILFLSLMLIYNFNKSPHVALAVAFVFVIILEQVETEKIYENCEYLDSLMKQNDHI